MSSWTPQGLKVYGAGEWHVIKHRTIWRRTWRELQGGVDEKTKEIVVVDLTASNIHMVCGRIGQVSGDRAYDTRACYESVLVRDAVSTILPRRNARRSRGPDPPPWHVGRDATLRAIEKHSRYAWRVASGCCTRQSLAENVVSRFKAVFGRKLASRRFESQQVEAIIKCSILNRMVALGLPWVERVF